jgi:hypothetical protein
MVRVQWQRCGFLMWTDLASGFAACVCVAADDAPTTAAKTVEAPALSPITLTEIAPQED